MGPSSTQMCHTETDRYTSLNIKKRERGFSSHSMVHCLQVRDWSALSPQRSVVSDWKTVNGGESQHDPRKECPQVFSTSTQARTDPGSPVTTSDHRGTVKRQESNGKLRGAELWLPKVDPSSLVQWQTQLPQGLLWATNGLPTEHGWGVTYRSVGALPATGRPWKNLYPPVMTKASSP